MLIRLQAVGHLIEGVSEGQPADLAALERDVMLVYSGDFESMDGHVQVQDQDIDELARNHNSVLATVIRMAGGQVPMKAYPPIQLDHSTSAAMTVGRLIGDLRVGETQIVANPGSMDTIFEKRRALLGKIKILGRENVEKVLDGRWTHVSLGMDLESRKINELSITPFPAAEHASLLSKKHLATKSESKDGWYVHSKGVIEGQKYQVECDEDQKSFAIFAKGNQVGTLYSSPEAAMRALRASISGGNLSKGEGMTFVQRLAKFLKLGGGAPSIVEKAEKMKKHLMDKEKLSDKEADEKLAKMSDEECTKLGAEVDEKEKKLAAPDEEEKKKQQLTAARTKFVGLAKDMRKTSASIQMASKIATINGRLSRLRSQAKITPAEIKKLSMAELSAQSDEAVELALKSYEDREPVVDRQTYGSASAVSLTKIAEKYRLARMETETRLNMPSKRKDAEKRLKEMDEEQKEELAAAKKLAEGGESETKIHIDTTPHEHYDMACMASKLWDEGKTAEAREHLKKLSEALKPAESHDGVGVVQASAGQEKQLSALVENVKRLQTQFQELVTVAGASLGVTEAELQAE